MDEKTSYVPIPSRGPEEEEACLSKDDDVCLRNLLAAQQARLRTAKAVIAFLIAIYAASAIALYIFNNNSFYKLSPAFRMDPIHGRSKLSAASVELVNMLKPGLQYHLFQSFFKTTRPS